MSKNRPNHSQRNNFGYSLTQKERVAMATRSFVLAELLLVLIELLEVLVGIHLHLTTIGSLSLKIEQYVSLINSPPFYDREPFSRKRQSAYLREVRPSE